MTFFFGKYKFYENSNTIDIKTNSTFRKQTIADERVRVTQGLQQYIDKLALKQNAGNSLELMKK
jgi:hypothetical protein